MHHHTLSAFSTNDVSSFYYDDESIREEYFDIPTCNRSSPLPFHPPTAHPNNSNMYMDSYPAYSDVSAYPPHDLYIEQRYLPHRQSILTDMHRRHRSIGNTFYRSDLKGMDDFPPMSFSQMHQYPEPIRGHQRMNSSPLFPSHQRSNPNSHYSMRYYDDSFNLYEIDPYMSSQSMETSPNPEVSKKYPYICRDFVNNRCNRGENCRFSHDLRNCMNNYSNFKNKNNRDMIMQDNLRQNSICLDYYRGNCNRSNCRYRHEKPDSSHFNVHADTFTPSNRMNDRIPNSSQYSLNPNSNHISFSIYQSSQSNPDQECNTLHHSNPDQDLIYTSTPIQMPDHLHLTSPSKIPGLSSDPPYHFIHPVKIDETGNEEMEEPDFSGESDNSVISK